MRKYSVLFVIVSLFTLLIFNTEGNCFAGAQEIKARMQQRLPTIVKLKSDGIIGENNKGYLEYIPGAPKSEATLVAEENKDRAEVYSAIARQQGTTVALVGERRAIQIREIAAPGEWLQDNSGKWYKK